MTAVATRDAAAHLTETFLNHYPLEAARRLETLHPAEAAQLLMDQPTAGVAASLERLPPGVAEAIIAQLPEATAAGALEAMSVSASVNLLARLPEDRQASLLAHVSPASAAELQTLLNYPENTVGRLMDPRILAFNQDINVGQALQSLRHSGVSAIRHLFLLNDSLQLQSQVDVQRLPLADPETPLATLAIPITASVFALDPRDEVMETLEKHHMEVLPVVDMEQRLVGVIEGRSLVEAMREDLVTDMQTMVGASADERALSPVWFAVRMRLPWLQINLLTAFMAAAVVALFEDTIAQFTALAVLMPIAAGQSGNTGAQALAVAMRGLTLREVTQRDWWRMALKELGAGLTNGLGVAVVCGLGVACWSGSTGLALVLALAMVISMTIAGVSGALVPMLLKRFGQDPAQSSSIVLTTITDITGFMSFLGIATLLADLL